MKPIHISSRTLTALNEVQKDVGMALGPSHVLVKLLAFVYAEGVAMLEPIQSKDLTEQEMNLLRANKIIAAIRMIRERTGLGLKESKDLADDARFKLLAS